MARSALFALTLSALATITYLGYRALVLVPVAEQSDFGARAEPVEFLPDFVLDNLEGVPQSIRDWPGQALVINFWATWCAPCLREIPLLKEFHAEHEARSVQVIGIAVDEPEPVAQFAADMAFNYPVLVGQSDAMNAAAAFGIDFFALPFTVFSGHDGRILGVHIGELHPEDLENLSHVLTDLQAGRVDAEGARDRLAGRQ